MFARILYQTMLCLYLRKTVNLVILLIAGYSLVWAEQISSAPTIWNVPLENPNFVGRKSLLAAIGNSFKTAPFNIVVIAGPSGFGKSQIAKQFAHLNYSQYDVVWWFKGNQYIEPQFENFALALDAELGLNLDGGLKSISHGRLIMRVREALRKKNLKCLIIFDDVQVYDDIKTYIPFTHDNNVHTLITTKNGGFATELIKIPAFSVEDSLAYLNHFFPYEAIEPKVQLADHFAGCPASLALAIDYIKRHPAMTIDGYLRQYNTEVNSSPLLDEESAKRLGSSTDGYAIDLLTAIRMNLKAIKQKSSLALKIIGFLSLLHHDALTAEIIKEWLNVTKNKTDPMLVVSALNSYSLVDTSYSPDQKKVTLHMHELIQKNINAIIPVEEKQKHIDTAIEILKPVFEGISDKVGERLVKDNAPFLHALKISEEADKIDYHTPALSSLRVRIFDILVGAIRDFKKAEMIKNYLQKDFDMGIKLTKEDDIKYNSNLFLFFRIHNPNFDKALVYGQKALKLIEAEEGMAEEKLRLFSNFIQYYSLLGLIEEAKRFVIEGEKYFHISQSSAFNALYILAKTVYHNEAGDFSQTIDFIQGNRALLEMQKSFPAMYSFTYTQLCEALVKEGDIIESEKQLSVTEKVGRDYFTNEINDFFPKLFAINALSKLAKKENHKDVKELLEKALDIYNKIYGGEDKHKNQGAVHLYLGKLHFLNQQYNEAKDHCLKSEQIYDKALRGKQIYDLSELYKLLAILGVELKDESLTHTYFKKQFTTFGIDHPNTVEISIYVDKKGLSLPY